MANACTKTVIVLLFSHCLLMLSLFGGFVFDPCFVVQCVAPSLALLRKKESKLLTCILHRFI